MINVRPPKYYTEGRDFERWMYNIWKKLGDSDTTFDDIDMRSISPLIGMLQDVSKKLEALQRDSRNLKAEIEQLKRKPELTRSMQSQIANLETRISQIEGEL